MKGKISLIKKGLGKIVFDKKESPVLSLPLEVEDGDIAEVEFDNERMDKIKKFVAFSNDEYYGNVIGDFRNGGIILVTYPKLIGTVVFKGNEFKKGSKVKFRLKKTFRETEAVDIEFSREFYKCFLPSFGKIEKRILTPKYGVVEEVVKSDKFIIEGEIKSVLSKGFGFIRSEAGDVFFFINAFERVFNRPPKKGEKVIFKYRNTPKGKTAIAFFEDKPLLPKNKQYFMLDGKKFNIAIYEKFFKKSPELGDMVYYIEEKGRIKFLKDDNPIEKYVFIKDEKGNFVEGEVNFVNENKRYGFIQSPIGSVYFSINQFEKVYNKKPQKGDVVKFFYLKSERGFSVSRFIENEFEVDKKSFSNFIEVNENDYYYAYINKNKIEEIFRYESSELSISISCYKQTNNKLKKLEAINCMLENEYESKRIKKETLLKEKLEILDKIIEENINNPLIAFEYEIERQKIQFEPERLKRFNIGKKINFLNLKEFQELKEESRINIIELNEIKIFKEKEEPIKVLKFNLAEYKEKEPKWNIKEKL